MDGCWAKTCEKCKHRFTWKGSIAAAPPCPKCFPPDPNEPKPIPPAVAAMIEECDAILSQIDDLPDAGYDFGESVREKLESIRDTIMEKQFVTTGQKKAIDNMGDGVSRWFHD